MVKFLALKITPRDFAARFSKTKAVYTAQSRQAIDNVADYAVKVFQETVPVRTGKLRNSIGIKERKTSTGTTDLRSSIIIGSPLEYYKFIDQGTESSPGRFVPAIGKRLISNQPGFGFHPGVPAQNITERVQARIERETGYRLNKLLKDWSQVWGVEFS